MLGGSSVALAEKPVVVPSPKRLVLGLHTSATVYRTGATGGAATKMGGGGGGGWHPLVRGGAITLGSAYLATVVSIAVLRPLDLVDNEFEDKFTLLLLPVLGPLMAYSAGPYDEHPDVIVPKTIILVGGLAQLTGAALLFSGLRRGRKAAPAKEGSRRVYSMAPLPGGGLVQVWGVF
jgi:hypothetical protein